MVHVVIMGAGIGGMPAAYEMKDALKKLGGDHKVTVVSNVDYFHFTPSNPWVAIGWRKREDITFKCEPYLKKKGIDFIASGVEKVIPEENRLELANGKTIQYDYLMIAAGPRLAFELVEGMGPEHYTQSICHVDHAEAALKNFEEFCRNPGPIVTGAVQGVSCYGPGYEYALILDSELRKRGIRDKVPMTYITPEPYIGHLGLGGVENSKHLLESEFRKHDIKFITNCRTTKVSDGIVHYEEVDRFGEIITSGELPFKFSMLMPAFRGVNALLGVDKLTNPMGFVIINEYQQNPTYTNVFGTGVIVAIPPVEKTPLPVGTPKTGFMIESMTTAAVHNIIHDLNGEKIEKVGSWAAVCLADMGDTGIAFVADPQIPPRNIAWAKSGRWVHLAKIGFEKYFIRKLKKGISEPFYEKAIMKRLGLTRLK